MNLPQLQKQIIDKSLQSFYIFTGEEIAIQKIYINKIAQIMNLEVRYVEELKTIYNDLAINDLFGSKKVYVILDDIEFAKAENVWNDIQTNGNIIIFKYNSLDKRGKFYKNFEDKVVEFTRLSDEVLTKYIQKEFPTLYEQNCKKLIDICDGNYNQILLELDKLRIYNELYGEEEKGYSKVNNIFIDLEEHGAFHKEISDITFTFIDRVMFSDAKRCYELQKQLKQIGESNIKLLSLLYTNFKIVLLIQSCKSNDIAKTTGLASNQIYFNKDKTGYYSIGELVNALRIIQRVEEGIKTGKIDEENSLDYVLVNIL